MVHHLCTRRRPPHPNQNQQQGSEEDYEVELVAAALIFDIRQYE